MLVDMQSRSNLQLWNAAAMATFILLAATAFLFIDRYGEFKPVGFFEITLLVLATFRLSHLFTNDKIFDFVRVLAFDKKGRKLVESERGWRRVLCEVLECLWCAGLWSALIIVTVYQLGRAGGLVVLLLAIAGAAALLSMAAKALANTIS
jgi:uncharacterized protein DUF1360